MQTLARLLNDCYNIYLFNLFIVKRPVALYCSYSPFFNKLREDSMAWKNRPLTEILSVLTLKPEKTTIIGY